MSIEKLEIIKEQVEEQLEIFFDEKILNAKDKISKESLEFLKDFTLRGGKRIRAGMLVYGYGCFRKIDDEIIKTAMAIELIQSYLLIHDDIIDRDELRRGKDSMHAMYEKRYNVDDKEHFGVSMAICVGDLAASLANEILLNSNFQNKSKAAMVMNKILETVVYGQMLDVFYGKIPPDELSEEDVLNVYRMKSASYTVEGPLHIGGILANVDEISLKPLLDYGIALGKGFQIRDDINGVFGNEEITGKPNDSDLKERKRTLLIIKTLNECNEKERKFILKKLGRDMNDDDVIKMKNIIRICSLEYCESLCDKYVEEAKNRIKNIKLNEEGKRFLLDIADYVAKRNH